MTEQAENFNKEIIQDWRCSSVVEHLPSLGVNFQHQKQTNKQTKTNQTKSKRKKKKMEILDLKSKETFIRVAQQQI